MRLGIGFKVIVLATALVAITAVCIGWWFYQDAKNAVLRRERIDLRDEVNLRRTEILRRIVTLREDALYLAGTDAAARMAEDLESGDDGALEQSCQALRQLQANPRFEAYRRVGTAVDRDGQWLARDCIRATTEQVSPPSLLPPGSPAGESRGSVRLQVRPDGANVLRALTRVSTDKGEAAFFVDLDLEDLLEGLRNWPRTLCYLSQGDPRSLDVRFLHPDGEVQPEVREYLKQSIDALQPDPASLPPDIKDRGLRGGAWPNDPSRPEAFAGQGFYLLPVLVTRECDPEAVANLFKNARLARLRGRRSLSSGTTYFAHETPEGIQELRDALEREFGDAVEAQEPVRCERFIFHFYRIDYDPADAQAFWGLTVAAAHEEFMLEVDDTGRRITFMVAGMVAGAGGLAFLFSRLLTGPLQKITRAAEGFGKGVLDVSLPVSSRDEIGVLARSFDAMVKQVLRDITERKRVEEEIKRLNENLEHRVRERTRELETAKEALEEARDKALAANRAKDSFLANMSHELRTPLNAIIGYSEMLAEEVAELGHAELVEDLERVHKAGRHLLSLINEVLDLAKVGAGKMSLYLESFAVKSVVQEAAEAVTPLARKNGNRLVVDCDSNLGSMHADRKKVAQVLLNLLSNACKFTRNGQVAVRAERVADAGVEWIMLRVSDTGIGIKPELLGRIFQPFEQADSGTSREFGGTGLGLAICHTFSRLMRGKIDVTSTFGAGATFTVMLPALGPGHDQAEQPAASGDPAEGLDPRAARPVEGSVLVIDDDPTVLDLMSRSLARDGFSVLTATGGEEGIQKAREKHPAAITLDVMMPGMDGWEILSRLKTDPATRNIPIVMVSMFDERGKGYALGASDYLTKPVDWSHLAAVLRRHVSETNRAPLLVVEDDAGMRELLCRTLRKDGWSVLEAGNGRVALDKLSEGLPALILLDLLMPEMDGLQFLARLRERTQWASIPVVVLTSMSPADLSAPDRARLQSSVQEILLKGASERQALLEEVRKRVAELMRQHSL
jgi:signal transduction histidine kinase/DNA-binding response OmpR family regulator